MVQMTNSPSLVPYERCPWYTTIPVGCWADIYFPGDTAGLKLVGKRYVVSKEAISWHLNTHNTSKDRAGMQANTHLLKTNKRGEENKFTDC